MKKAWIVFMSCFILTICIHELPMWALPLKYCSLAYLIYFGSVLILQRLPMPHIPASLRSICKWCSLIVMTAYTIVIIDTFWFHALTWFPGLIRYPIIDAYGLCYFIFIIPGLLWHFGTTQKEVMTYAKS